MTGVGGLDWRGHSVGPARPCRLCHRPAFCRDEQDKPCHKVCAERHTSAPPGIDAGQGAVFDLDSIRPADVGRAA